MCPVMAMGYAAYTSCHSSLQVSPCRYVSQRTRGTYHIIYSSFLGKIFSVVLRINWFRYFRFFFLNIEKINLSCSLVTIATVRYYGTYLRPKTYIQHFLCIKLMSESTYIYAKNIQFLHFACFTGDHSRDPTFVRILLES